MTEIDYWELVSDIVMPTREEKIRKIFQKRSVCQMVFYLEREFVKNKQTDVTSEQIRRFLLCDPATVSRNLTDMSDLGLIKILRSRIILISPVNDAKGENVLTKYLKLAYQMLTGTDGSVETLVKSMKEKAKKI